MNTLTKSILRQMLSCPQQGYYANQGMPQDSNDQLDALAKQGYIIDAYAKKYHAIDFDLMNISAEEAVKKTKKLLMRPNVTIAEAAFIWNGCLVRTDILVKEGNTFTIKEIKSSSWNEGVSFTQQRDTRKLKALCRDMLYDLAFQTYVVRGALDTIFPEQTEFDVQSVLITPDSSKTTNVNNPINIVDRSQLIANSGLTEHNVTQLVFDIIKGNTTEQRTLPGGSLIDFITFCKHYLNADDMLPPIGPQCKDCCYKKMGGFHKCWSITAKFDESDFLKPSSLDLNLRGNAFDTVWKNWHVFQEQITPTDLGISPGKIDDGPLSSFDRTWLQIGLSTQREDIKTAYPEIQDDYYIYKPGIKSFLSSLQYPIHLIDFESCTPAVPMYSGQACYELIPFQFSHHVVTLAPNGSYKIEHIGQYVDVLPSDPSFRFARALKKDLDSDNGSILRYAAHENTVLRAIRQKLISSSEADKDELIMFIDSITEPTADEKKKDKLLKAGNRNMIDLERVIKECFITRSMGARTSIKVVLPAILSISKYLNDKYSKDIYGSEIKSLNIMSSSPIRLIKLNEEGEVVSPYHNLTPLTKWGLTINKGDAAAKAYEILQGVTPCEKDVLVRALQCYCEIDTMAMVLIWEYFNEYCRRPGC